MKKLCLSLLISLGLCSALFIGPAVSAASCGGVSTSVIDCGADDNEGSGIFAILNIILTILTYGVGIAATVGFVVSGIQYATARDDAGQLSRAKNRIIQIIIGLFLYAGMWAVLNFLLPGGLFNNGS